MEFESKSLVKINVKVSIDGSVPLIKYQRIPWLRYQKDEVRPGKDNEKKK